MSEAPVEPEHDDKLFMYAKSTLSPGLHLDGMTITEACAWIVHLCENVIAGPFIERREEADGDS